MVRALTAAALVVTVAACGGSVPHSASPAPSPPHTATPSATPPASASTVPDNEAVSLVASGFGAYDLEVFPVSILHNLATAHTATGVIVRFTVQFPGGSYALSAEPVALAPGETLAVTAQCTDSCDGAAGVGAAVTVGGWAPGGPVVIAGSAGSYACGSPCAGSPGYEGDVSGTLSGGVPDGTLINVSAACMDVAGTIVGGGLMQSFWSDGSTLSVTVPVLVTTPPASCQLYATEVS
ncbi:MAG: hypothetical protein ACLQGJ_07770 [Candidatus Dormibacteria bacterium]